MRPLVILDFDGVLFNSAHEVYAICQALAQDNPCFRNDVSYKEFLSFRKKVTDAWQFNKLYSIGMRRVDFTGHLFNAEPDLDDIEFCNRFFEKRKYLNNNGDAFPIKPYPFFFDIINLLKNEPYQFRVLSTRDESSINKVLSRFGVSGLQIFGQSHVRKYGSKELVIKKNPENFRGQYKLYIDDMRAHVLAVAACVDLSLHADWGYDESTSDSVSAGLALRIIKSFWP